MSTNDVKASPEALISKFEVSRLLKQGKQPNHPANQPLYHPSLHIQTRPLQQHNNTNSSPQTKAAAASPFWAPSTANKAF